MWECRLFREIATARSMSRGAVHCGVSQSAATQHVQEVERRLGVTLFDRSKRPLELTEAGKLYADYCRDVLAREEELVLALEGVKGAIEGTVRVASIYSIGISEMNRVQEGFARSVPSARLEVEYMRPDRIYGAVRDGAADIGLVSFPEAGRDLLAIPWRNEEMRVAVPPAHALATRPSLELSELDGVDFVAFDDDLIIRREVDRFLRSHGVSVHTVMHFDNIQMIKEAVAVGSGVSILPTNTLLGEIARGRLLAIPFASASMVRPVGLIHRRRKKLNRAALAFLELLTEGKAAPPMEPR
jgi:LysR family transcriptional regulator, transcriptional activator of the cysJI operon